MNESTLSLAVAVLRVSTGEQVAGTSLPEQEAACRVTAERDGFEVVAVCSDEGLSGTLFASRAGLQEAIGRLAALRQAHPSAALRLYFSAVDRATRDAAVLPEIKRALRPLRAEVRYANVTIDNSSSGRFIESTLGSVAAFEREIIRDRTTKGKIAKARAGIQTAVGWRPFGYELVMKRDVYPGSQYSPGDVGRYFIAPDEARLLRHVFAEYGAGRMSLRGVASWLNDQGSLTTKGNAWHFQSLHGILKNPIYKGAACYGREEHWREEVGGSVKRRKVRRSDAEAISIPCPAIVTPEVWESVQRRFQENRQTLSGNPARRYMLSGLLRCPECGAKLYGHNRSKAGLEYGCASRDECGRHVPASRIEAAVVSALAEIVARPEIVRLAMESYQKIVRRVVPSASGEAIRKALQNAERDAQNAARAVISAMSSGRDPKPYEDVAQSLAQKAGELRERLAQIGEETGPIKSASVPASVVVDVLSRAGEILSDESLPAVLRNRALSALVESVTPIEDGTEPSKRGRPRTRWGVSMNLKPFGPADTVGGMLIRWTVSGGVEVVVGRGRGTP